MLQVLFQGMVVGIALAAPIGPINIEIIRRGLSGGFVNGWLVGIGAMLADTLLCILVVSGVAPIADSARLRVPLYLVGAVVLGYLGFMGLRAVIVNRQVDAAPVSGRRSLATGFMMAISNPMGLVYWLSIGSALIASAIATAGRGAGPVIVAGVFSGIALWTLTLAALTQAGRSFVSPSVMRWISAIGALVLVAFAVYFGWLGVSGIREL